MKLLFSAFAVLITAGIAQADPALRTCLMTKVPPLAAQMQAASACATDKSCTPAPLSGYERVAETQCFEEAMARCDATADPGQCVSGVTDYLSHVTRSRAGAVKPAGIDAAIADLPFFQKRSLAKAYDQHVQGLIQTDCDIPEAVAALEARLPKDLPAQTICAAVEAFGHYQILRRLERAIDAAG
ncbi:MAG: hypothetical protein AAFY65_12550 [Pseudomonadota bacterium]